MIVLRQGVRFHGLGEIDQGQRSAGHSVLDPAAAIAPEPFSIIDTREDLTRNLKVHRHLFSLAGNLWLPKPIS